MKIRLIELLKSIRKNFVSFISVSIFIFLAVTLFEGLLFSGQAIKSSVNKTFTETHNYDVKLTMGSFVDDSYINDLLTVEDVKDTEGFFAAYDNFEFNQKEYTASIFSLTSRINNCVVVDGELPKNDNEIAIFRGCSKELNINVGDQITFTRDATASYFQTFARDFGDRDLSSIDSDNFKNFNTPTFTVTAVVIFGDFLNHEYASHPIDLESGIQVEAAFYANYSAFNPLITGNRFNGVYVTGKSLENLPYYSDNYDEKVKQLQKNLESYNKAHSDHVFDFVKLDQDYPLRALLKEELYECGAISEEVYNDDTKYNAFFDSLISSLDRKENAFSLTNKNSITGAIMGGIISDLFLNEKYAIGGVFFVISLLICYSAITRLVSDESTIIGTKKALGFSKKEVIIHYLSFTLLSVLIGLVLGNVTAYLLEGIMVPVVFKQSFSLVTDTSIFDWSVCLIMALISFVLIAVITLLSSHKIISKKAVNLLQGNTVVINDKPALLEKTKLFKKLPLFYKTVFRNFKHDFKRIFATVIGISSSIALLMASFSLRFTIQDSFNTQFNNHYHYDTIIYIDDTVEDANQNLISFFNEKKYDYASTYVDYVSYSVEGHDTLVGTIYVYFDNDAFNKVVTVVPSSGNPEFDNKGFWLPESYQKEYRCGNESIVKISSSAGTIKQVTTTGFFKYYAYKGTIFVDKDTYEKTFETEITPNSFLVNRNKTSVENLNYELSNVNGFRFLNDSYGKLMQDIAVFNLVCDILFALYGLATFLLAVFVILNLFVTYVKEKKRELITLMVNGYSRQQTSKYIYLDTIFLTILSLLIGTGLGMLLSLYGLISIESHFLYFIHSPNAMAILLSNVITIVIVIIITLIALREIKKFKLKDINNA